MTTFKRNLTIRHMRLLETLNRTLSIVRCAEELNTSQSAVSRGLRELEELLGARLFDRNTRNLSPTILGRQMIRHADLILNQLDRAEADFYALVSGKGERLDVGLMGAVSPRLLSTAIGLMERKAPNVTICFHSNFAQDLVADLLHNRCDLIVSHFDIERFDKHDEISVNVLYSERVTIASSFTHPLVGKDRVTWRDLVSQRWVLVPAQTSTRRVIEHQLLTHGAPRTLVVVETLETHLLLELVRTNGMLTALPVHFVHWLQHDLKLIRSLPLADDLPSWPICSATLASREPTIATVLFLECLQEAGVQEQLQINAS